MVYGCRTCGWAGQIRRWITDKMVPAHEPRAPQHSGRFGHPHGEGVEAVRANRTRPAVASPLPDRSSSVFGLQLVAIWPTAYIRNEDRRSAAGI
jgi:hypothetical protein